MGSPLSFKVKNESKSKTLLFIDANEYEYEIPPQSTFTDISIPLNVGAKRQRKLYFRETPEETIVMNAEIVAHKIIKRDVNLHFILGIV